MAISLPAEIGDDDPVVPRVRDEHPPGRRVGEHLAGKIQRLSLHLVSRQLETQRRLIELADLSIVRNRPLHHGVVVLELDLAALEADRLPLRINQEQRRPRPYADKVPNPVLGIDGDRVLDVVPQHRLKDVLFVLLGLELGRVDPDHDKLVGIRPLQLLQLRQDVHAVDAAIRPKIEQHELPPELLERERPGGIDPAFRGRQFRHLDPLREGVFQLRFGRSLLNGLLFGWARLLLLCLNGHARRPSASRRRGEQNRPASPPPAAS